LKVSFIKEGTGMRETFILGKKPSPSKQMNREEPIEDHRYYHVYNRGNDRKPIFRAEPDYRAFLEKMRSLAVKHSVAVPVYTLMPNHYHVIALQEPGGDLSKMMGALATSTAKRYNLKYGHSGHLFQGPFHYNAVSEDSVWGVACYIHLNPVRAGLAKEPAEWEFSNFAEYVEGFLHQGENQDEGNPHQGKPNLWNGYAAYVREVLKNEQKEREYWKRVRSHVEGFLPSE
jgi:REP element-mobilizing transposase RayT